MSIGMRLTAAGKQVLARGLLGEEIKFTKISIGDGDFDYDSEKVYDLTALRNWRMDLPLTKMELRGDGTVYVQAYLSNAEVYQGFACREHGLIAIDPATGNEILFAYVNKGTEYDFVPSNTGTAFKNIFVNYVAEISDCENVTAVLDLSVAYINTKDFDAHINAEHPHPNAPNHFDNVTDTDFIWATDNDNHLHKISVNNFKQLLRDDTAEAETVATLSDEEKIFRAKQELGLDANLLIIEDFTGDSALDNFKIKVTSSAENGNLLGLESVDNLKTGAYYTISDGVNAEKVQIASVRYNVSGYHAKLVRSLSNSYDWNATYLYRTTPALCDSKVLTWQPKAGFGGVEANIARTLELDMTVAQDFYIEGDGFLTKDGYFTLAR